MNGEISQNGHPVALPGLSTQWLGQSTMHFDVIGSTNDFLKSNALTLPHGQAATASLQTAGKGRLGRAWSAAGGASLALSFLLHNWEPQRQQALPLLVGLGVSKALESLTGSVPMVKWSNDILMGTGKLCGILCESRILNSGACCVAGIGVNLTQSREDFQALDLVYATSLLLETGKIFDFYTVAAKILTELEPLLDIFSQKGFSPFREEYTDRCATVGKDVLLHSSDGSVQQAKALDISENGSLICSVDGRLEHIQAGEVSVRGLYGYA